MCRRPCQRFGQWYTRAVTRAGQSSRPRPTFDEEAALLEQRYTLVAGLDEVGRGPLAGPVVAGVAVFPEYPTGSWVSQVRDSKQMTHDEREEVLPSIREAALATATGAADYDEVDRIGIVAATHLAMRRALDRLPFSPEFLLLDAFGLPGDYTPQKPIVRGDASCFSIAAASIVAKVTRDRLMVQADTSYPGYGFASNKGYATKKHLDALSHLGPCPIHRRSFSPIRDMLRGNDLFFAPLGTANSSPEPQATTGEAS